MGETTADEQSLKYHLINKYRELVARRYDDIIKNIDQTELHLSTDVASEIKDFFLDNIYPKASERRKLDAAFGELRNFTTNPALIWGLLGSLPVAIFQFGMQLPQAIQAGMTSLRAYTSAMGFEEALLHAATKRGYTEPLTDEKFFDCLRDIPKKQLNDFINEASSLFTVITDTSLLTKTIHIMKDVVSRMERKPEMYTADQVAAIQIGLDLMENGFKLLEPYDEETRKAIISFVSENEKKFIAEIHDNE
jgi:hypothetical protein